MSVGRTATECFDKRWEDITNRREDLEKVTDCHDINLVASNVTFFVLGIIMFIATLVIFVVFTLPQSHHIVFTPGQIAAMLSLGIGSVTAVPLMGFSNAMYLCYRKEKNEDLIRATYDYAHSNNREKLGLLYKKFDNSFYSREELINRFPESVFKFRDEKDNLIRSLQSLEPFAKDNQETANKFNEIFKYKVQRMELQYKIRRITSTYQETVTSLNQTLNRETDNLLPFKKMGVNDLKCKIENIKLADFEESTHSTLKAEVRKLQEEMKKVDERVKEQIKIISEVINGIPDNTTQTTMRNYVGMWITENYGTLEAKSVKNSIQNTLDEDSKTKLKAVYQYLTGKQESDSNTLLINLEDESSEEKSNGQIYPSVESWGTVKEIKLPPAYTPKDQPPPPYQ